MEAIRTCPGMKQISDYEFAVIIFSSLEKDKGLPEANEWLITTMARAKNTWMKFNELVEKGEVPLQIEPVSFDFTAMGKVSFTVKTLTHSGVPTGNILPTNINQISIDGYE